MVPTFRSMKHLLPADRKAIALAAWLFYAERGFDAQLIHQQCREEIELRVVFDDSQELPACPFLSHPSFSCSVTHLAYSDRVFICNIPEAFM